MWLTHRVRWDDVGRPPDGSPRWSTGGGDCMDVPKELRTGQEFTQTWCCISSMWRDEKPSDDPKPSQRLVSIRVRTRCGGARAASPGTPTKMTITIFMDFLGNKFMDTLRQIVCRCFRGFATTGSYKNYLLAIRQPLIASFFQVNMSDRRKTPQVYGSGRGAFMKKFDGTLNFISINHLTIKIDNGPPHVVRPKDPQL